MKVLHNVTFSLYGKIFFCAGRAEVQPCIFRSPENLRGHGSGINVMTDTCIVTLRHAYRKNPCAAALFRPTVPAGQHPLNMMPAGVGAKG